MLFLQFSGENKGNTAQSLYIRCVVSFFDRSHRNSESHCFLLTDAIHSLRSRRKCSVCLVLPLFVWLPELYQTRQNARNFAAFLSVRLVGLFVLQKFRATFQAEYTLCDIAFTFFFKRSVTLINYLDSPFSKLLNFSASLWMRFSGKAKKARSPYRPRANSWSC